MAQGLGCRVRDIGGSCRRDPASQSTTDDYPRLFADERSWSNGSPRRCSEGGVDGTYWDRSSRRAFAVIGARGSDELLRVMFCAAALTVTPSQVEAQTEPERPIFQVREVLRIGADPAVPDWQAFAREPKLLLGDAGRLYVMPTADDQRVRVIDHAGDFVQYVGRSGAGPGEFRLMARMGLVRDTLWIMDGMSLRMSFFGPGGEHLETGSAVAPAAGVTPGVMSDYGSMYPLVDGRALWIPPAVFGTSNERLRLPLLLGSRSASAVHRDTVAWLLHPTGTEAAGVRSSRTITKIPPLYAITPQGDGVVVADWHMDNPTAVVVRRHDVKGVIVWEAVLELSRRPIPPEARHRFVEERVARIRSLLDRVRRGGRTDIPIPDDLREQVIDGSIIPGYYAPVDAVFATAEGRVWLHLTDGPDDEEGPWFVIGPDGEVEFLVRAPDGVRFQTAFRDRVWGTGTGSFDVPYIGLYEVIAAPSFRQRGQDRVSPLRSPGTHVVIRPQLVSHHHSR